MRVLFCGGGTAGHITPALAIAEEIKKYEPHSTFLFVGRDGGSENNLIAKDGYALKTIKIKGLARKISIDNLKRIFLTLGAIKKSKEIIKEFRPDIVVGTGGYVCLPVILAANQLKVKSVIHESNVSPGLTTKLLSSKVNRILLGHSATANKFKTGKYTVVGNPLRADFQRITRETARRSLGLSDKEVFVLSFGGSLGSDKMNSVICRVMADYSAITPNLVHIHATGERYYEKIKKEYHLPSETKCKIVPYITDMPIMMKAADIVISRCGAMTLAEISESGVASILIPSPNVSDNHQYKNGMHFSCSGAAYLIEEEKLTAEELKNKLKKLKIDENGRKNRAKISKSLSEPNSAKKVVNELKRLILG